MLTTILYRSHNTSNFTLKSIADMVDKANKINEKRGITGILLFNGTHFFQLLEGPEKEVRQIYARIHADDRHHNVVELMRDYAPYRRFGKSGMELFLLEDYDASSVLNAVLNKGTSEYQLTFDDRALQFLRTFVEGRDRDTYHEIPPAGQWEFQASEEKGISAAAFDAAEEYSFAFQPIVDPLAEKVVSLEALFRDAAGRSPADVFAKTSSADIYRLDLTSKARALSVAAELEMGEATLSMNLLPMTLVSIPGAVNFLLDNIKLHGFIPQQIVIEITEDDVITSIDDFEIVLKELKSAGIKIAIDDFGAGTAGLMLLSRIQPEKIKIDRSIITDIHTSGPKQAIVMAILRCCVTLEINVIVEGVEKPEEWMWLEAAGITHFQGFLFARPALKSLPPISWPVFQEGF